MTTEQAAYTAEAPPISTPEPDAALPQPGLSIAHFLGHQIPWCEATFGPGTRRLGVAAHIDRELAEARIAMDAGERLEECIDVVILGLDGAWRAFGQPGAVAESGAHLIEDEIADHLAIGDQRTSDGWDLVRAELDGIRASVPDDDGFVDGEWARFAHIAAEGIRQARMTGAPWPMIRAALYEKLATNIARNWPDWRGRSPDAPIEHVRAFAGPSAAHQQPGRGADGVAP